MKFAAFASLLTFALGAHAASVTANTSLDVVACSNGVHGLEHLGYTNFGSLPTFPFIGGAGAVEAFDSVNCGTCWQLTYTNGSGAKKSINVLAIDHAAAGTFNIALEAMNTLTGGQAAIQVDKSVCKL
ncbi:Cerato-platanin-domain-containing protein [Mycena metata]|uniref:Cerato-platanin-domain-containing protein n=1 Tax=Mycena metata TaxID=1033252 RepID=A0AAD7NSC2_9AGAR|nr:Cerato-platanin-domain-containing protein [Mycena metata]